MQKTRIIRIAVALVVTTCLIAGAALCQGIPDRELVVGTKETAPFVIENADGTWRGISIELWQDVADKLGLQYRFVEHDLEGLLAGLRDTSLDVVAAALTVTAERENTIDFSHPFYATGLSIAVSSTPESGTLTLLSRLVSADFLLAVGALLVLLAVIGIIAWLAERRKNPEEFGGSIIAGIGSGLWWSAVTMTTVGYGDKAPKTFLGRVIGLVWMFAAIIIVSGFTATIASSLTVSQLETPISGPNDLPYVKVGTVPNSTSAAYLKERSVSFESYNTPADGLRAVAKKEVEAFVYDAPILRYLTKTQQSGRVRVLPVTFFRQDYAIALPQGSALREPISKALLEEIQLPQFNELLEQYMGD